MHISATPQEQSRALPASRPLFSPPPLQHTSSSSSSSQQSLDADRPEQLEAQPPTYSSTWPGLSCQTRVFPVSSGHRTSPLSQSSSSHLFSLLQVPLAFLSTNPCPSVLLSLVWSCSSKGFLRNTCPHATSVTCGYPCSHLRLGHTSVRVQVYPSLLSCFECVPFNHEHGRPLRAHL